MRKKYIIQDNKVVEIKRPETKWGTPQGWCSLKRDLEKIVLLQQKNKELKEIIKDKSKKIILLQKKVIWLQKKVNSQKPKTRKYYGKYK